MFRRKEESLFDNEFPEDLESVKVIQSTAATVAAAANTAAPAAPAPQQPAPFMAAAPAASAQPITRSASVPPVTAGNTAAQQPAPASAFRPSAPAQASAPVSIPSRQSEVKSMTPNLNSQFQNKATSRVLTVGNDILLKGEITACDRLLIEGKVEATVSDVNTLELAECGSFKGSANVADAQISGLFEGDLVVTGRLVIYASGKVRGNVTYGEIEIERGGELTGQIKSAGSASGSSSVPKALQKAAA